MANRQRHRKGQMDLRKFPILAATDCSFGDMMWWSDSDSQVRPASDYDHDVDLATTQAAFADVFAGIAYEQSDTTQSDDISVDLSADAIYEFDCASSTYDIGDPLGPDESSVTGVMEDQKLETAVATSSVARCAQRESAAVTSIYVQFASSLNLSANTAANVVG